MVTEGRSALEEESFAVPQTLTTWRENGMPRGTPDIHADKNAESVVEEREIRLWRLRYMLVWLFSSAPSSYLILLSLFLLILFFCFSFPPFLRFINLQLFSFCSYASFCSSTLIFLFSCSSSSCFCYWSYSSCSCFTVFLLFFFLVQIFLSYLFILLFFSAPLYSNFIIIIVISISFEHVFFLPTVRWSGRCEIEAFTLI